MIQKNREKSDDDKKISELISRLSKNIDFQKSINDILEYALEYYEADRAYIFDVDRLLSMGCNTYEVCADGVTSEINNLQNISFEIAPRWIDRFSKGETVFLKNIEDLKEIYYPEYKLLKAQNITSLIAVPYNKMGINGCIGVDNPKKNCQNDCMLKNLAYIVIFSLVEEQTGKNDIYSIRNKNIKNKNDIFVKTFGDFEVNMYSKNYNISNVNSKQCLFFFLYLLLNRNEVISVEKLSDVFWPNQDLLEPYNYIKNMAFRTRKKLKNITDSDIIIAKNGSYSINSTFNIVTDYEIVDALYKESEKTPSPNLRIENYKKIIEIYDNTMFNNLSKALWMISFINKYKYIYIEVVEKYLKLLYSKGEYQEMLKVTERAIKINHRVFKFHYYTIKAYLAEGKNDMADLYLDEYHSLLNDEEFSELKKMVDEKK